jgi:hypothetical protein
MMLAIINWGLGFNPLSLKHQQTNTHDHHVNDSSFIFFHYLPTYLPTQELCIQDMVKILPPTLPTQQAQKCRENV